MDQIKPKIEGILRIIRRRQEEQPSASGDSEATTTASPSPSCPTCLDSGWIARPAGLERCACAVEKFRKSRLLQQIPERYRGPRLADVRAYSEIRDRVSVSAQSAVIDELRKRPLGGWIFFGPTGSGKTYLLYRLVEEAVMAGRRTYVTTCRKLVRASVDNNFGRLPDDRWHELVEPRMLVRGGSGPCHLFVDELDKAGPGSLTYDAIFDIVQRCYDSPSDAVLSATTNYPEDAFVESWGEALYRKLLAVSCAVRYEIR